MSFEPLNPQPAARGEDMLLGDRAFTADSPYNRPAPGLYPGETALALDSGELVAVSIDQPREEAGSQVAFHGTARWIGADGTSVLCGQGKHVESAVTFNPSPSELKEHGEQAIAKDVLLILLGEAPRLLREAPVDGGDPVQVPVVDLAPDALLNASIRNAIVVAQRVAPQADVAALLDVAAEAAEEAAAPA